MTRAKLALFVAPEPAAEPVMLADGTVFSRWTCIASGWGELLPEQPPKLMSAHPIVLASTTFGLSDRSL